MDTVRGLDDERSGGVDATTMLARGGGGASSACTGDGAPDSADAGVNDVMFDLGGDERRMHVRALNRIIAKIEKLAPGSTHRNPTGTGVADNSAGGIKL